MIVADAHPGLFALGALLAVGNLLYLPLLRWRASRTYRFWRGRLPEPPEALSTSWEWRWWVWSTRAGVAVGVVLIVVGLVLIPF